MLLMTVKKAYEINVPVYILAPIGFFGVIALGWFDYNYIFLKQVVFTNKRNDIKIQLDRVEKKLDEMNKC